MSAARSLSHAKPAGRGDFGWASRRVASRRGTGCAGKRLPNCGVNRGNYARATRANAHVSHRFGLDERRPVDVEKLARQARRFCRHSSVGTRGCRAAGSIEFRLAFGPCALGTTFANGPWPLWPWAAQWRRKRPGERRVRVRPLRGVAGAHDLCATEGFELCIASSRPWYTRRFTYTSYAHHAEGVVSEDCPGWWWFPRSRARRGQGVETAREEGVVRLQGEYGIPVLFAG